MLGCDRFSVYPMEEITETNKEIKLIIKGKEVILAFKKTDTDVMGSIVETLLKSYDERIKGADRKG